jgi:hypothetical protein
MQSAAVRSLLRFAAFAATTVIATALSALAQPQNESSIKGENR